MRLHARVWVLSLICGVLLAGALPAVAGAQVIGIEKFVATNCKVEGCGQEKKAESKEFVEEEGVPVEKTFQFFEPKKEITVGEAHAEGFTQAGGRVPYGVTDFKLASVGEYPERIPTAATTHIRTDVAPGLATNPFAVKTCSLAAFGGGPLASKGLFEAPGAECSESKIGTQEATIYTGKYPTAGFGDVPVSGAVYDLVPAASEHMANGAGLAALYGVAVKLPKFLTEAELKAAFAKEPIGEPLLEKALEAKQWYSHSLIKGSVEWGKEARGTEAGDYHDYFEIEAAASPPLLRSRLVFEGTSGNGAFITNATSCPGNLTTSLTLEGVALEGFPEQGKSGSTRSTFTTPIGLEGCNALVFAPKFTFTPSSTLSDSPAEFSTEASEEHNPAAIDVSQVRSASFTLPEGMTLNPSAAAGLEACTTTQAHQVSGGVFGEPFGVECPVGSKIGTVSLNVPTLPDGSLTGSVYLASGSTSGTITGPPYDLYVVANSATYGISVRLFGETVPSPTTGQLTTYFNSPPEQPFTSLKLTFERGVLAPIANPLICGPAQGSASFTPTSGEAVKTIAFGPTITGCTGSTPPFALSQSTENENEQGGGHTSYAFRLARADGNGYLKKIRTSLPLGLVGAIPDVTLCAEAQANAGTCGAASKIGSVSVLSGAGSSPYTFYGTAYMTGPYGGQPYGMSIVVQAIAGPFNLGPVVTRASIAIDKFTSQATVESELPTIVKGIPIRLRAINLDVNRQGFLYNPTNCATQATLTTLTSTEGATQTGLSSPFTVTGCEKLPLAPKFSATTSANVSRATGTSLVTRLTAFPGESNIKSVKVQLPRSLPSRDSTLKQACVSATFEAGPTKCPSGSIVGTAEATTPTLPGTMKGNVYFVAHGNAAFPDLDLVLEDQGVQIILVGNTDITKGITTTTFASTPDVPVSSVTVSLPAKSNSAVGGYGDLCRNPLYMPTTITGQNGKVTKLNPVIAVTGCRVKIVGHRVFRHVLYLTIQTFGAGRISASGNGLKFAWRNLSSASRTATLKVPLSNYGNRRHKPMKVKVRVGFVPKQKGPRSYAYVTVVFH